jgi:PAS domain S-box-containing protein
MGGTRSASSREAVSIFQAPEDGAPHLSGASCADETRHAHPILPRQCSMNTHGRAGLSSQDKSRPRANSALVWHRGDGVLLRERKPYKDLTYWGRMYRPGAHAKSPIRLAYSRLTHRRLSTFGPSRRPPILDNNLGSSALPDTLPRDGTPCRGVSPMAKAERGLLQRDPGVSAGGHHPSSYLGWHVAGARTETYARVRKKQSPLGISRDGARLEGFVDVAEKLPLETRLNSRMVRRPVTLKTSGTQAVSDAEESMGEFSQGHLQTPDSQSRTPRRSSEPARIDEALADRRNSFAEAEQRYLSLLDALPIPLYRCSPEGRLLDCNLALARLLQCPDRQRLLGTDIRHLYLNLEDGQELLESLERQGTVPATEVQWRRRDGSAIWIRNHNQAVRGASGQVLYYEGVVEDITELMLMRSAAEGERRRFFALLDSLPACIYVQKSDLSLWFANRLFKERFGELSGRDLCEALYGRSKPDEPCAVSTVFETGNPMEFERTRSGDSTYRINTYRLDHFAASPVVLGVAIDVTERKRDEEALVELAQTNALLRAETSEQQRAMEEHGRSFETADRQRQFYQEMAENLPAAVAILRGPQFVYEFANRVWKLTCLRDDLLGKTYAEVSPKSAQQWLPILKQVLTTGQTHAAMHVPITHASGSADKPNVSYLNFTFSRVPGTDGQDAAILAMATDAAEEVLAHRRAEEITQFAQEEVSRLSGMLKGISGVLSNLRSGSFEDSDPS